jgi:hypothetical protein
MAMDFRGRHDGKQIQRTTRMGGGNESLQHVSIKDGTKELWRATEFNNRTAADTKQATKPTETSPIPRHTKHQPPTLLLQALAQMPATHRKTKNTMGSNHSLSGSLSIYHQQMGSNHSFPTPKPFHSNQHRHHQ